MNMQEQHVHPEIDETPVLKKTVLSIILSKNLFEFLNWLNA